MVFPILGVAHFRHRGYRRKDGLIEQHYGDDSVNMPRGEPLWDHLVHTVTQHFTKEPHEDAPEDAEPETPAPIEAQQPAESQPVDQPSVIVQPQVEN